MTQRRRHERSREASGRLPARRRGGHPGGPGSYRRCLHDGPTALPPAEMNLMPFGELLTQLDALTSPRQALLRSTTQTAASRGRGDRRRPRPHRSTARRPPWDQQPLGHDRTTTRDRSGHQDSAGRLDGRSVSGNDQARPRRCHSVRQHLRQRTQPRSHLPHPLIYDSAHTPAPRLTPYTTPPAISGLIWPLPTHGP